MGNVKHLANPLAKQAAQLVIKFANKNNKEARLAGLFYFIVFRLVRDVVANHKTTRYAGAATKVIQKNHLA